MNSQIRRSAIAAMVGIACWAVQSGHTAAQSTGTVTVAEMTIHANDAYTILPDVATMADGSAVPRPTYRDWRLSNSDYCVQGAIYSTGDTALVLNRRMPDGDLCGVSAETRTYGLRIENTAACEALVGATINTCTVSALAAPDRGMPQVHAGALFKSKSSRTPVTFYFGLPHDEYPYIRQFRLKMDVDLLIHTDGSKKMVSADHTATLAQSIEGRYRNVAFGIPMRFQIEFERLQAPGQ